MVCLFVFDHSQHIRHGEDGFDRAIRSKTNNFAVQTAIHHIYAARCLIDIDVHRVGKPTLEKRVCLQGLETVVLPFVLTS